jgi:hypothetical protein
MAKRHPLSFVFNYLGRLLPTTKLPWQWVISMVPLGCYAVNLFFTIFNPS